MVLLAIFVIHINTLIANMIMFPTLKRTEIFAFVSPFAMGNINAINILYKCLQVKEGKKDIRQEDPEDLEIWGRWTECNI